MIKDHLAEIFFVQIIIYIAIWFASDYIGSFISISFPIIFALLLLVSIIAELIEPSRVPRWYFYLMIISIIAPILVGGIFWYLSGGKMDWFQAF